jgi:hypothetical protein
VVALEQQLQERDMFLTEIHDRLIQAQGHMKEQYDGCHCDIQFVVGDWVWLRLNQCAAVTVCDSPTPKLAPKFFGPYEVTARIGPISYRLHLPAKARIHDVLYVVFLKRYMGTQLETTVPLPPIVRGRTVPQHFA